MCGAMNLLLTSTIAAKIIMAMPPRMISAEKKLEEKPYPYTSGYSESKVIQ